MEEYHSCHYIQNGINFYPNDIIKVCCVSLHSAVDICTINEDIDVIIQKIIDKKRQMIQDFRAGNISNPCKGCPYLVKTQWGLTENPISSITFNHYMTCNLKCTHCGYYNTMKTTELRDTNHKDILYIIQQLIEKNIATKDVFFDFGGGEPSISKGILDIVDYGIKNNHKMRINSNGAKYIEIFANGINKGSVEEFLLTPDAGSREVYKSIKGVDCFDKTWETIEKYVSACPSGVKVKFILEDGNLDDIDNMIDMCVKKKVKEVMLNLDLCIKKEDYYKYIPYMNKFRNLAQNNSLIVHKGYAIPEELWAT